MKFKIRDKRNKGWFYIDNEYLNGYAKIFGPIGVAIYVSFCRHANNEQTCYPSYQLLSKELGISIKTIQKYIRLLKEYNIIQVTQEKNSQGKFKNNLYILMDKEVWVKPPAAINSDGIKSGKPPQVNRLPTGNRRVNKGVYRRVNEGETVGNQLPQKNTNKKNTNKKKTNIYNQPNNFLIYTEDFLKFWEIYPKKVGKGKAFEAWQKRKRPIPSLEEIIKAVEKHKKSRQWREDDGKYIPYPATWINQRRWEDEPEEYQDEIITIKNARII